MKLSCFVSARSEFLQELNELNIIYATVKIKGAGTYLVRSLYWPSANAPSTSVEPCTWLASMTLAWEDATKGAIELRVLCVQSFDHQTI